MRYNVGAVKQHTVKSLRSLWAKLATDLFPSTDYGIHTPFKARIHSPFRSPCRGQRPDRESRNADLERRNEFTQNPSGLSGQPKIQIHRTDTVLVRIIGSSGKSRFGCDCNSDSKGLEYFAPMRRSRHSKCSDYSGRRNPDGRSPMAQEDGRFLLLSWHQFNRTGFFRNHSTANRTERELLAATAAHRTRRTDLPIFLGCLCRLRPKQPPFLRFFFGSDSRL